MSEQHSPDQQQQHQHSPGITIQEQYPAETDATVRLTESGWATTKLHRALYEVDGLADRLIESVRATAQSAESPAAFYDVLEEAGVTTLNGGYIDLCVGVAKGRTDAAHELVRTTRQLGGQTSHDVRTGLDDLQHGDPAVFAASETVPTIAISMSGFTDAIRDHRENVLALVRAYARGCRVVLVAGPIERTFLWRKHRKELPGSVKDECKPRLGEQANPAAVETRVEDAREAFDHDSKPVAILQAIAAETSETLTYSALAAAMDVGRGTIRNHVTQRLQPHALVERFDHLGTAHVSLSYIGRQFVDALDHEIGVQSRIDDCVKPSGNLSDNSRVIPPAHEGRHGPAAEAEGGGGSSGGAADDRDSHRHRLPFHHQVRGAARHRYAAAAGSASDGGIALVDHPITKKSDRAEPHWYYDHEADRLVVGAEYDNPMQWWVCIALALTNARTFRHVFTPDRFESGKLGDLLANHTDLLRNSRCLGYLKDADATAEGYTDALLDAAEDLYELTKHLHDGNYENETRFRGEITCEALGLAGTMVHLLDLADVDVVREARIPRFSRDFKPQQKDALAETLSIGASIQSRYREFAAYRQLFERREEKRDSTFPPSVDAEDPYGELIGSFVIVGKGVEGFADRLRRRLSTRDVHDDAPEFGVRVSVEIADERQHVAHTVQIMCRQKSLQPTRAATSILAALAGTPYDVASALHALGGETKAPNRKLRLDEVRYALSSLATGRILPEMSQPALSKIVHALLVAETPLVQSELADRADVSKRSVRNHGDRLAAFDFVRETDAGWRFALPFHTDEERGEEILPWFVATAGDDKQEQEQATLVRDVLAEAVYDLLDPGRYADPDDAIAGALFVEPGKRIPALREAWEWLNPWLSVVRTLCDDNSGCGHAADECNSSCCERMATVGVEPDQASLTAAAGGR
jgi:hypothetical protein